MASTNTKLAVVPRAGLLHEGARRYPYKLGHQKTGGDYYRLLKGVGHVSIGAASRIAGVRCSLRQLEAKMFVSTVEKMGFSTAPTLSEILSRLGEPLRMITDEDAFAYAYALRSSAPPADDPLYCLGSPFSDGNNPEAIYAIGRAADNKVLLSTTHAGKDRKFPLTQRFAIPFILQ